MSKSSWHKIISCIATIVLIVSAPCHAQNSGILTWFDGKQMHIRWQGMRSADVQGYYVYRQVENATLWKKLNEQPISMVTERTKAENIVGYKASLFFELFGQGAEVEQLSRNSLATFYQNSEAVAYMEIFSLINPEFGHLLGEIFVDNKIIPGPRVRYKITYLIAGQERDLVVSEYTDTHIRETISSPEGFAGEPGFESAKLEWNRNRALLSSGKIVSYRLYRSTELLGPYEEVNLYGILPVRVTSGNIEGDDSIERYNDKFLINNTTYYYHVKSINAFNMESDPSVTVKITPIDNRSPSPPTGLYAEVFGTAARISWTKGRYNNAGFEVYKAAERSGEYIKVFPVADKLKSTATSWIDTKVEEGDVWYYFVRSTGESGSLSTPSDTITFQYADTRAPSAPEGIKAIASDEGIRLSWNHNKEKDIKGYEIERSGEKGFAIWLLLNTDPVTENFFLDPVPRQSQTEYGYRIFAIDKSMNTSTPSAIVKAKMADEVPPQVPIITSLSMNETQVNLAWTKGIDEDLSHYRVYRSSDPNSDWNRIGEALKNKYLDSLKVNGTYYYTVSAVDETGNESEKSKPLKMKMDFEPLPPTPASGNLELDGQIIRLSWSVPSSDLIAGYVIRRTEIKSGKALDIGQIGKDALEFNDLYPNLDIKYEYMIRAYDNQWRYSNPLKLNYDPKKHK